MNIMDFFRGSPKPKMTRFAFNESKAVEAVVLVATDWPGITPFFLAKTVFFADRNHLREYGRPITGDAYMAMPDGPVPSSIYDMVKDNVDFFGDPQAIHDAFEIKRTNRYPEVYARRKPNLICFRKPTSRR